MKITDCIVSQAHIWINPHEIAFGHDIMSTIPHGHICSKPHVLLSKDKLVPLHTEPHSVHSGEFLKKRNNNSVLLLETQHDFTKDS